MLDTYRNSRYLTLPLKFSKENNVNINREGFVISASVIDAVMRLSAGALLWMPYLVCRDSGAARLWPG